MTALVVVLVLLVAQFGLEDPAAPTTPAAGAIVLPDTTAYAPKPTAVAAAATATEHPVRGTTVVVNPAPSTSSTTTVAAPTQSWSLDAQQYTRWSLSVDGVPFYSGRSACSPAVASIVAAAFGAAGASSSTQAWAIYVASRETGCDTSKRNQNSATGDDSFCLFQINALAGWFSSRGVLAGVDRWATLHSVDTCARAAATMWQLCGRAPWTKPNYGCAADAN